MKKSSMITTTLIVLNITGWFIYSSHKNRIEELEAENEILKSELDFGSNSKKIKRSPSSLKKNQLVKSNDTKPKINTLNEESIDVEEKLKNTEHLNDDQRQLLLEAYQVLDPSLVEQFKTKEGQRNLYKNVIPNTEIQQELNNLKAIDQNLAGELGDMFNEKEISYNAQTQKYLKESGDIPPDNSQMNMNNNNKTSSQNSEKSSSDLDNDNEK